MNKSRYSELFRSEIYSNSSQQFTFISFLFFSVLFYFYQGISISIYIQVKYKVQFKMIKQKSFDFESFLEVDFNDNKEKGNLSGVNGKFLPEETNLIEKLINPSIIKAQG